MTRTRTPSAKTPVLSVDAADGDVFVTFQSAPAASEISKLRSAVQGAYPKGKDILDVVVTNDPNVIRVSDNRPDSNCNAGDLVAWVRRYFRIA